MFGTGINRYNQGFDQQNKNHTAGSIFASVQYGLFCVLVLRVLLLSFASAQAVPAGTEITNTALATYGVGSEEGLTSPSNTVIITTTIRRTPSTIEFLKYAPLDPNAEDVMVCCGCYSTDGLEGSLVPLSPPCLVGSTTPLDICTPLPLVRADFFHQGEPVFIRLTDGDQNLSSDIEDTVLVRITFGDDGEEELLQLIETGLDTGVFTACIQSEGGSSPTPNNGVITVEEEQEIQGEYADKEDPSDTSSTAVLVDPVGIVFDSSTGNPVNGAVVTLINADTGASADIFGDNGISSFPSSVTTGGTATDSSGKVYSFGNGKYRFPLVHPGNYRIEVTPPAGYAAPSTVSTSTLQSLQGAPFNILEPGSRGEDFVIDPGPIFRMDIPLDPRGSELFVSKRAGDDVVAIGDFLQYEIKVSNEIGGLVGNAEVVDRLPLGFRYRSGSLKIDDTTVTDPQISSDGRTLTISLGDMEANAEIEIRYVVEVAAGARLGEAINTVRAAGDGNVTSNVAEASVRVKEDLFRSKAFIIGTVFTGPPASDDLEGVEGVRIYLEDGTYVVTDEDGKYHFEGVEPGTHVVQMDTESIPEGYMPVLVEKNTRFAGRAYSQFVDIQGGTLWRADFYIAPEPITEGRVILSLSAVLDEHLVTCAINIKEEDVPVSNRRLTVMLPENCVYQKGSSTVDGVTIGDPRVTQNYLTFSLNDAGESKDSELRFSLSLPDGGAEGGSSLKAVLSFNTPSQKGQKTPMVEGAIVPSVSGISGVDKTQAIVEVNTKGISVMDKDSRVEEDPQEDSSKMPDFGKAWMEKAEPGLEWLWPSEEISPAIPSVKLAIKHSSREKIKLFLNGQQVSPLNYDGMTINKKKAIAVSKWRGVDIKDGNNIFEAAVYDSEGTEISRLKRVVHYSTSPVTAEYVKDKSVLEADGKAAPLIAVRLRDKEGFPVREGLIGSFTVDQPYESYEKIEAFSKDPLGGRENDKPRYVVAKDGIAYIKLQPTTRTGEVVLHFDLDDEDTEIRAWLEPAKRDWILVGLVEGTVGYNTLDGNMENLSDAGAEDEYYSDGRVAFFAKGRVKGEWLLTLAYDSDKETDERTLYQTIDPDSYYTLYGDATQQQYEASSSEKLYVKIERKQFYALFGDYDTGLTVTELSKYSRSLTGYKAELQTDRYSFNVFAAETDQTFVKDEIRGDGTSGPYRLSRNNIVENSDKVTIEVRDRFRSEEVLSSTTLSRHIDYDIDYDDGTIDFREPIFSRNEDLDPIYIVVDYETWNEGGKEWQYGGRGAVRAMDGKLEVGATYIHEESEGDEGNLTGADLTLKINEKTTLKAEYAQTSKSLSDGTEADDDAYLVEVEYQGQKVNGEVYVREQGEEFGLGQQSGTESGTRKIGADISYRVSEQMTVDAEAYRHYNLETDAERDVAEVEATYRENGYFLSAGLRHAEDRFSDGTESRSEQITLGASKTVMDGKLNLRVDHDQSIGGDNDNSDFPTRTTLGADYKLDEKTSLFVEHEFTWGEYEDSQGSRLGLKTTLWEGGELTTSLEREFDENGSRLYAGMGLNQKWKINEKWSIDAGVDYNWTVDSDFTPDFDTDVPSTTGEDEDFTALSFAVEYRAEDWTWNMRTEYRDGDNSEKINFRTGFYGEPREGLGVAVSLSVTDEDSRTGTDNTDADLSLGMAYRPRNSKWTLLDKLELIYEEESGGDFDFDEWRIVNNFHANYKASSSLQVALQYGLKYVETNIDEMEYSGFTHLLGVETRYDINEKWDVGFRASVLHSWDSDQLDYSTGVSLGYNLCENTWMSLGYNFTGFEDEDFSQGDYTAEGVYLKLNMKVDQDSLKDMFNFKK